MLKKGMRRTVTFVVLMCLVLTPLGAGANYYSAYAEDTGTESAGGSNSSDTKTEPVFVPDDDDNNNVEVGSIEIGRMENDNPLWGISAAEIFGVEQSASLVVNGDVTVEGGASTGISKGVDICGELGKDASLNVKGDIKVNADDYSLGAIDALAGDYGFGDPSSVDINVDGNLEVKAKNSSCALQTRSYNGDAITTQIGGNVTSHSQESHSNAIYAESRAKSKIATTVKGDITSKSDSSTFAMGILVYSNTGGDIKIDAEKNVSVESDFNGYGIFSEHDDGTYDINIGGDVSSKTKRSPAYGVYAIGGESGYSKIDIAGKISAESSESNAIGIQLNGYDGDMATITVGKDIISTSGGSGVHGILIENSDEDSSNADANIKVGGSVIVTSTAPSKDDWGRSYAVDVTNIGDSETNIDIGGDIISKSSSDNANGVRVDTLKNDNVTITVGGSITAETDGSLDDSFARGIYIDNKDNSRVFVSVEEDIISNDRGIVLRDNNAALTDILVKDTIDAKERGVLYLDGSDEKALITVWKIVLNERGNAIEKQRLTDVPAPDGDGFVAEYDADEKAESEVMYIVKVQEKEGYTLKATKSDGSDLEQSHDFDIAREGDKVILDLALADGYKLVGAYNGLGEDRVSLLQDEEGNYYYIVPKGGAVYLYAEVEPDEKDDSASDKKDDRKEESNIEPSVPAANQGANAISVPKTGDEENVIIYCALFMLSILSVLLVIRIKNVRNYE